MSKKFFETTIVVKVLSEEVPLEFDNLQEVHHAITDGDCSGSYEVSSRMLTPKATAIALRAQGSDPGFFQLDDEGNEV